MYQREHIFSFQENLMNAKQHTQFNPLISGLNNIYSIHNLLQLQLINPIHTILNQILLNYLQEEVHRDYLEQAGRDLNLVNYQLPIHLLFNPSLLNQLHPDLNLVMLMVHLLLPNHQWIKTNLPKLSLYDSLIVFDSKIYHFLHYYIHLNIISLLQCL